MGDSRSLDYSSFKSSRDRNGVGRCEWPAVGAWYEGARAPGVFGEGLDNY